MKFIVLVGVAVLVVVAATTTTSTNDSTIPVVADDKYTTKYDNINLDEVLTSDRLLNNYCKCLLDLGKCTPDGQELKSHIIEALQTGCVKCSDKQKKEIPRVLNHLKEHRREDCFDPIIAKYDPENEYQNKYQAELEALP